MASVEGGAMSSPLWLMRTLTDPSDSFDVRKKAAEHANPNPDPKPNPNPKPKPKPKPNPNPNPSPSPNPSPHFRFDGVRLGTQGSLAAEGE